MSNQKHRGTCSCSSTGRSPMNDEKEPFVRNRNQKTEEAFNALESARKCLSEQEKSDAP